VGRDGTVLNLPVSQQGLFDLQRLQIPNSCPIFFTFTSIMLQVHLSIAGGRKTMAVFGMTAAQLLFDEHDRLWHLFSGGEFLVSKRLYPQPGDEVRLSVKIQFSSPLVLTATWLIISWQS
jgi:hypothetical protein